MTSSTVLMKKTAYLKKIFVLSREPESVTKSSKMEQLLNDYYIFCHINDIDSSFVRLRLLLNQSYIIPSEPDIIGNMDEIKVISATDDLKYALETGMGITEEEANLLLTFVVQNARKYMGNYCDIRNSSLIGYCGLGQLLTMVPFKQVGAKTTSNNTNHFPNCNNVHAFGTVTLPIVIDNKLINKTFLLDTTYRQFFSSVLACYGRYFAFTSDRKSDVAPWAGYFMVRYPKGNDIADKILKDGFIELTPDVLKAYASCFAMQSVPIYELEKKEEIKKVDVSQYYESLEMQDELAADVLQLMEIEEFTKLPSNGINR